MHTSHGPQCQEYSIVRSKCTAVVHSPRAQVTCRAQAAQPPNIKHLVQVALPAVGGALAAALLLQPTAALADLNRQAIRTPSKLAPGVRASQ